MNAPTSFVEANIFLWAGEPETERLAREELASLDDVVSVKRIRKTALHLARLCQLEEDRRRMNLRHERWALCD